MSKFGITLMRDLRIKIIEIQIITDLSVYLSKKYYENFIIKSMLFIFIVQVFLSVFSVFYKHYFKFANWYDYFYLFLIMASITIYELHIVLPYLFKNITSIKLKRISKKCARIVAILSIPSYILSMYQIHTFLKLALDWDNFQLKLFHCLTFAGGIIPSMVGQIIIESIKINIKYISIFITVLIGILSFYLNNNEIKLCVLNGILFTILVKFIFNLMVQKCDIRESNPRFILTNNECVIKYFRPNEIILNSQISCVLCMKKFKKCDKITYCDYCPTNIVHLDCEIKKLGAK